MAAAAAQTAAGAAAQTVAGADAQTAVPGADADTATARTTARTTAAARPGAGSTGTATALPAPASPGAFRAARAELVEDGPRGTAFCPAYTSLVDAFLAPLVPDRRGVALVAVGGYGRGDLCPGSDVDVLLLHALPEDEVAALADDLWYPLWDTGLKVGHAVRTVAQALAMAADDLHTATALLDCRLIAGHAALAADLAGRARASWRSRPTDWLGALADSAAERHRAAGELAFLLEPDLKESRGGLRDVHSLRWADAALPVLRPPDAAAVAAAAEVLLGARVELHRRTGKGGDQLLLQEQDAVAAALGDDDADALMARVGAAGRAVAWASDETWGRVVAFRWRPPGRVMAHDRALGGGLVLRDGAVELAPDADPAADPGLVLRAAATAVTTGARLSRMTLDRLAAEATAPGDPWPDEARQALVGILGAGRPAVAVLESLDQTGLLVRTVPEWAAVRHRPQRNAYHRFTVDRHLCEAAANAAGLADRVGRPDLLVVGAWLHDLGKGYAGTDGHDEDHSVAGVAVVEGLATRMGFPPADVATLATLVRHHLLLADAATRRDLDDPATIGAVAQAVGDATTLELLHALTEADSLATGPAAWSTWKAGLVAGLVLRVTAALAGQPVPVREFPAAHHRAVAARAREEGGVVAEVHGQSLVVAAPDRPGLFCRVAGTLAVDGLDVLAARVWADEDGTAVEDLRVEPVFGEPDWARVESDLRRALSGRLALEARLAERARLYAGRSRPRAATPPRPQVVVTNDASDTATVVEVHGPDRLGALYRITRALADLDLDIRSAKVSTTGHEVVDTFYVVGASGTKVTDAADVAEIERAVAFEVSRA
ncbi:MAG: [protein-PII] uridylyltransferase [Acidimicrobiales bacterium]